MLFLNLFIFVCVLVCFLLLDVFVEVGRVKMYLIKIISVCVLTNPIKFNLT